MVIYGVALLSGCLIAGLFCGQLLGRLIGVQANVGGVGIAMLLLILVSDRLRKAGRLKPVSQRGIVFWSFGMGFALVPVISRMGGPGPGRQEPEDGP